MHLKSLFISVLIFYFSALQSSAYPEIRPENNAYRHNNKGIMYMREHNYYNAALEFQTAIDLMPNAQGTSSYYLNLASAYQKMGYSKQVMECYEKAVKLNPLSFDVYRKTAEWYKQTGMIDKKLLEYKNKRDKNPLDDVMIGLLYIQKGQTARGITLLDNFCCEEEDLLITEGIRKYIENIDVKKKKAADPFGSNYNSKFGTGYKGGR